MEGAVEGVEGAVEGDGDVMYVTREDGQVRIRHKRISKYG